MLRLVDVVIAVMLMLGIQRAFAISMEEMVKVLHPEQMLPRLNQLS
jgi:hypothetical protein